jgi:uncharacterized protein YukE
MSGRVLSSPEAKAAITAMQGIINGGLQTELSNLNTQGQALSEPSNWDGPLAITFRSNTWPETHAALTRVQTDLDALQKQLQTIATNIMTAGGGS